MRPVRPGASGFVVDIRVGHFPAQKAQHGLSQPLLQLPHPLAADAEFLADLLEGHRGFGQEALFQHPGLAGLQDAWRIFMYGATAGDILHASKLDGSPSGTALGNRLRTAADWVEKQAGCIELACAMRSPSIEVSRDGTIRYNPARNRPVRLFTH